jgi:chromate transporter
LGMGTGSNGRLPPGRAYGCGPPRFPLKRRELEGLRHACEAVDASPAVENAPHESYARLFLRFLRFGLLAWGGPVAQIAMVREELVEREKWISRERFNRVLSVYQVLPGPEAHELCVYFGFVARGRVGGLLAGLGFMLPGFVLMLVLSWAYVRYGIARIAPAGLFYGFQAAVLALIVRAVQRIGRHALTDPWLWAIATAAVGSDLAGVHFGLTLVAAGLACASIRRRKLAWAGVVIAASVAAALLVPGLQEGPLDTRLVAESASSAEPSLAQLFGSGLLAGLLTFGGAYTVIPFLQREAVAVGAWMTNGQFVDGLALSGVLPAPLVIFGTFVGYLGGGLAGAVAVTAGIFLPAFGFTLIGHGAVERLVEAPALHAFLDGVTAGVVGLIVAATIRLAPTAIPDVPAAIIAAAAFALLSLWSSKMAIAVAVLLAGGLGMIVAQLT